MRQWEIYRFPQPSTENPHPCVILSPDRIAGNPKAPVNVLACTSLRPGSRINAEAEIRLDHEDGLSGPTILICAFILAFGKDQVMGAQMGMVCRERQQAIKNMLARIFNIYAR